MYWFSCTTFVRLLMRFLRVVVAIVRWLLSEPVHAPMNSLAHARTRMNAVMRHRKAHPDRLRIRSAPVPVSVRQGIWNSTHGRCVNANGDRVRSVGSGNIIQVTLETCQAYCAAEPGCEAFSYHAAGEACRLRGTMAGPEEWVTANEDNLGPVVGGDGTDGNRCYIKPAGSGPSAAYTFIALAHAFTYSRTYLITHSLMTSFTYLPTYSIQSSSLIHGLNCFVIVTPPQFVIAETLRCSNFQVRPVCRTAV